MWTIHHIVSKGKYNYAVVPKHPNATDKGYVLEHRIVMENSLGRLLRKDEVVHHKNGNTKDNVLGNLSLMTKSEHSRGHQSTGRKCVELICPECQTRFIRSYWHTHLYRGGKYTACSRHCNGKISTELQNQRASKALLRGIKKNVIGECKKTLSNGYQE